MTLVLVQHRMPPSWDGQAVTWEQWKTATPMFVCPPPPPYACEQCGTIEPPMHAFGLVEPREGDTFESTKPKTGRWGHVVHVPTTVPAWATLALMGLRCPDCLHTVVDDLRTNESWVLGPEDYTGQGSVAPVVKQWTGGLFDLLDESDL